MLFTNKNCKVNVLVLVIAIVHYEAKFWARGPFQLYDDDFEKMRTELHSGRDLFFKGLFLDQSAILGQNFGHLLKTELSGKMIKYSVLLQKYCTTPQKTFSYDQY